MDTKECFQCQKKDAEVLLTRCRICHKQFCEEHAVQKSGIAFCSLGCAQYFFHVDPDADDEADGA